MVRILRLLAGSPLLITMTTLGLLAALYGCAGQGIQGGGRYADGIDGPPLPSVVEQLKRANPPEGVDAAVFNRLKHALAAQLQANGALKAAVAAPRHMLPDLAIEQNEDGSVLLTWSYENKGDYDQNSTVNIADLTPLGVNFGAVGPFDLADARSMIDGDENGEINLADLTAIGTGFQRTVDYYLIEGKQSAEQPDWDELGVVSFSSGEGGFQQRRRFSFLIEDPCGIAFFRVTPYDSQNNAGQPTELGQSIVLPPPPPPPPVGSIAGAVLSEGQPVAGAVVSLPEGDGTVADAEGQFVIESLLPTERLPVTVTSPGLRETTVVYEVVALEQRYQTIELVPREAAMQIDTESTVMVPTSVGASIMLQGMSLQRADGTPMTGSASLQLTAINAADPASLALAPGDMTALQLDESEASLESFGMLEVFIGDGTGQQADLIPGQTAQLTFPIDAAQQADAPDSMPLYSFDTESGLWIEEGAAVKDPTGTQYIAEVGHFSTWNCDRPLETVCVGVEVRSVAGVPLQGVRVHGAGLDYTGTSSAVTDGEGYARLPVRVDSEVEIHAAFQGTTSAVQQIHSPVDAGCDPETDIPLTASFQLDVRCIRLAVTGLAGNPLENVAVTATQIDGPVISLRSTDAQGVVTFPAVAGAEYEVVASVAGRSH